MTGSSRHGATPTCVGATLTTLPTTRPRYTVTDTGDLREMLDLAQRRWPEVRDRRQLLLRLAEAGHEAVAADVQAATRERVGARQRAALDRAAELVDESELLSDSAWR